MSASCWSTTNKPISIVLLFIETLKTPFGQIEISAVANRCKHPKKFERQSNKKKINRNGYLFYFNAHSNLARHIRTD